MPLIETGVSGYICAAHRDARGRLHGHTYEVRAWFPAGRDAIDLQTHLAAALRVFDHKQLYEGLETGEALCSALAANLHEVTEIEISRPSERIYARWKAERIPTEGEAPKASSTSSTTPPSQPGMNRGHGDRS